ncbi:Hypothetical protein A7982_05636 [Minicystis rosea]|nr:Hypothetical protein A7982_05636 [Minicystis rosea]
MSSVKGAAVTARVRFVRERHGELGFKQLLAAMPPTSRALLEDKVLPQAWVPYDLFVDVCVTADQLFGRGDLALCFEMGRHAADVNLPTLYRIFYRLGNPQFIMRRAAQLWSVHYDSGKLESIEEAPGSVRLRISEFERPHRAHCLSVLGWAARSIELSGATLLEADEARCRTRGDTACELVTRYRE